MSRYSRHYKDYEDYNNYYGSTWGRRFAGQALVGVVIAVIAGIIYFIKEWLR